jgi:hypothetical protein
MGADMGFIARDLVTLRLALTRCLQLGAIRDPDWIAAHYGSR